MATAWLALPRLGIGWSVLYTAMNLRLSRAKKISRAEIEDAEQILALQKLAYQREAELYNDYTIPALTQTLPELREQFKDHVVLKVVLEGKIIGTVRAYEENGTCHVGRLAVHPKMQNQGIGTALLKEIEKYYQCKRFELFTGSKSDNNIHLYQKLGYAVFGTLRIGCGGIELLQLEKLSENQIQRQS